MLDAFITRWDLTERAERANYQSFLGELCDVVGLPRPDPAIGSGGSYRFERGVRHLDDDARETPRRIDLYKSGCFILEAKQGTNPRLKQESLFPGEDTRLQTVRNSRGWVQHMLRAKGQAEGYVRDLPTEEPAPVFLIVCDVGFCFDLYADFSGTGRHYAQFPDRESFRIYLRDLAREEVRDRLIRVWTDPMSLNPSRRRTLVTEEIAQYLGRLAKALEKRHPPDIVAVFLMRCIFCMFAQSVGLLPAKGTFTDILERCRSSSEKFVGLVGELWRQMNSGGFSAAAEATIRRFNGGLYSANNGPTQPLALTVDEIALLLMASKRDWADVEPAIFGTLVENALSDRMRGELGSHFTPRAYVERLVLPTVMEPLRADWDSFKAAAYAKAEAGDIEGAAALIREFHARLCNIRVLDPACGTGNFLYVTMELMKRLEGEVLDNLSNLIVGEGDKLALQGASVDPHQFLGLEKNPRAVPVAELVLWIGYLQWYFRTLGVAPHDDPILGDFHNIRQADALLTYEAEEPVLDREGRQRTRWNGESYKSHPVTGEPVPDHDSRVGIVRLIGARQTEWPKADFIVGNPPFIAGKDLREELGDPYVDALCAAYDKVPASADLALFFWWRAYQSAVSSETGTRRFGLISSNSLKQPFCRRVLEDAMTSRNPVRLVFAIPDHPWYVGRGAAAVRIAMSVAEAVRFHPETEGLLLVVETEDSAPDGVPVPKFRSSSGLINSSLTTGTNPDEAKSLRANEGVCSPGVKLHGSAFIRSRAEAKALGLGSLKDLELYIRPYRNGRDITQRSRDKLVIDLYGLDEQELRASYTAVWQYLRNTIYEQRRAAADRSTDAAEYFRLWWLHGKPRPELKGALAGLDKYIVTVETAKHRVFSYLSKTIVPDNRLICFASSSDFVLGVLSSSVHVKWALAVGGTLEDRPVYTKTRCFDPFPFPRCTAAQHAEIGATAREIDNLRRTRLDNNPQLTLTFLYNVMTKVKNGEPLTDAERDVHDRGHVSLLLRLHEDLDLAVSSAYGWPVGMSSSDVVSHIVALNAVRKAEEADGVVSWLRPGYQAPTDVTRKVTQATLDVEEVVASLRLWPKQAPEQFLALRSALQRSGPSRPVELARQFEGVPRGRIGVMLRTLAALGQAREAEAGIYAA